ncbi:hypothetical protein Tco_0331047 [Tanacetum coccineum]
MSSDNASSAVTYTSVSSDSNGPSSWGISTLMSITNIFPSQKHPITRCTSQMMENSRLRISLMMMMLHRLLSPVYIADAIRWTGGLWTIYPEEDPSEKHEPEDDDDDDDTDDEDEEPTEEEEEEEEHLAPTDSSLVYVVNPVPSAGDTEAFETDESAPIPRSP